jgi:carboxyl-terminal processing protease
MRVYVALTDRAALISTTRRVILKEHFMRFKTKIAIVVFSSIIAFYAIVGSFMSRSQAVAQGSPYGQFNTFNEVLRHIINDYVDQPDIEKVRIGSLRGLAEGLDAYSAYLTAEQVKQYDPKAVRGETGLILSKVSGYAYVVAVLKGSPAAQAGIRDGDVIEYVGKVPSRDLSLYDIEQFINGQPGTGVEVRILHRGQSRKLTLTRAKIVEPAIESRVEETGIGYIKVTTLAQNKSSEVKSQLTDLVSKGAQKIILDLRGAAKGKIEEGVAVANLFIGSGTLARVIGKEGKDSQTFKADPARVVFNGPLAVIIDRSTAGAAEIIAAAVRDQKRGEVLGERSFGAGSEQQLFTLSDGGALLLTTAKYAPAAGKPFMEEPVQPTEKVDRPAEEEVVLPADDEEENAEPQQQQAAPPKPDAPVEDVQLKKAVEILKRSSTKANAPQKQAALNTDSAF